MDKGGAEKEPELNNFGSAALKKATIQQRSSLNRGSGWLGQVYWSRLVPATVTASQCLFWDKARSSQSVAPCVTIIRRRGCSHETCAILLGIFSCKKFTLSLSRGFS